jgi:hypothetical protein
MHRGSGERIVLCAVRSDLLPFCIEINVRHGWAGHLCQAPTKNHPTSLYIAMQQQQDELPALQEQITACATGYRTRRDTISKTRCKDIS